MEMADHWQRVLNDAAAACEGAAWRRIIVCDQVESTQDAATGRGAAPGDVVTALRQTAGRGRHGRRWADTADQGAAMSFVLAAPPPAERGLLALRAAVAAARAVERFAGRSEVGIKWPNDVMLGARKVAGVLIETADDRAIIGIGINVLQEQWPAELASIAISLKEAGVCAERIEVLAALLQEMAAACAQERAAVVAAFHERDVLTGRTATLTAGGREHRGEITAIDPLRAIRIRCDGVESEIAASVAQVVAVEAPG